MKDYEVFIGPFSARAKNDEQVRELINEAYRRGFLSYDKAIYALEAAEDVIAGEIDHIQADQVRIYDRARRKEV